MNNRFWQHSSLIKSMLIIALLSNGHICAVKRGSNQVNSRSSEATSSSNSDSNESLSLDSSSNSSSESDNPVTPLETCSKDVIIDGVQWMENKFETPELKVTFRSTPSAIKVNNFSDLVRASTVHGKGELDPIIVHATRQLYGWCTLHTLKHMASGAAAGASVVCAAHCADQRNITMPSWSTIATGAFCGALGGIWLSRRPNIGSLEIPKTMAYHTKELKNFEITYKSNVSIAE